MEELQKILSEINSDLLTEETNTKISDLFEAIIAKKTSEVKKELQKEHDEKVDGLDAQFEDYRKTEIAELENKAVDYVDSELFENFNQYVTHVAEEFVKENKLELSEGVKAHMFDKMVNGVRDVLAENSIDEKEVDVDSFNDQIKNLKESLEQKEKELMEQKTEIKGKDVSKIFTEIADGLNEIQKSELKSIIEDYSVEDLDTFKRKVETAKKLVVKEKTINNDVNPDLSSDQIVDGEDKKIKEDDLFEDNNDADLLDKVLERF